MQPPPTNHPNHSSTTHLDLDLVGDRVRVGEDAARRQGGDHEAGGGALGLLVHLPGRGIVGAAGGGQWHSRKQGEISGCQGAPLDNGQFGCCMWRCAAGMAATEWTEQGWQVDENQARAEKAIV